MTTRASAATYALQAARAPLHGTQAPCCPRRGTQSSSRRCVGTQPTAQSESKPPGQKTRKRVSVSEHTGPQCGLGGASSVAASVSHRIPTPDPMVSGATDESSQPHPSRRSCSSSEGASAALAAGAPGMPKRSAFSRSKRWTALSIKSPRRRRPVRVPAWRWRRAGGREGGWEGGGRERAQTRS